jgi:hypothetical protein
VTSSSSPTVALSNHIVINCSNRYFKLVPFGADGDPWSVGRLEWYLERLERHVENNPRDAMGVAGLTCTDRNTWAMVRFF